MEFSKLEMSAGFFSGFLESEPVKEKVYFTKNNLGASFPSLW
jgi:hypothetical protein